MKFLIIVLLAVPALSVIQTSNGAHRCEDLSPTTASGSAAPHGPFCPGDLIFEDNFDTLNHEVWHHENTLAGSGNWEFQWYTNNRSNSFTDKGILYIRPTLSEDTVGTGFIEAGTLNLHGGSPADQCTNPAFWGCERSGSGGSTINPVKSARLRLVNTFNFKYGKVEVRAKMPTGDWLWPAIWFLPKNNAYGTWPASGEINLIESRGNRNLVKDGINVGVEQMGSTLHFGPYPSLNGWPTSHYSISSQTGDGWNNDFHKYQMSWSPKGITFSIDDVESGAVDVGQGFWQRGGFSEKNNIDNPWRSGTLMAPFDKEFYMVMNLAVGGIAYFPDDAVNEGGKPWHNHSPQPSTDFWNGRNQWLPTWNLEKDYSKEASMQVDYIKIWAL